MAELTDEEIEQWRADRKEFRAALSALVEKVEAIPTAVPVTAEQLTALQTDLAALKAAAPDQKAAETITALQLQVTALETKFAALPPSSKEKEDGPPAPPPNQAPPEKPEVKPTRADKHGWL